MPAFEVFIPARDPESPNVTLTIEAPNWIGALKSGLKQIGEGQDAIANVMCDIKEDNSIHVTDVSTKRVFRLREVAAGAAAPARPEVAPVKAEPRPISMPAVPAIADHEPTLKNPVPPSFASPPTAAAPPSAAPAAAAFPSSPKTLIQFQAPKLDIPATVPSMPRIPEGQDTMQIAAAPMPAPPAPAPSPPAAAPAAPAAPTPAQKAPVTAPAGAVVPQTLVAMPAAEAATVAPKTLIAQPAVSLAVTEPATQPPQPAFIEETQKIPIKEMEAEAAAARAAPAPSATSPTPSPSQPIAKVELKKATAPSVPAVSSSAPTPRGVPAPAPKRPSGQFQNAPAPQARAESKPQKTDPAIGRPEPARSRLNVTDAIAEVFDATQDLYLERALTPQKIAEKMVDIALAHIPAESGTFYLADVNGHELTFSAVRGPKADAIKRAGVKVKVGQGIIGFCAQEGVCLLVTDIQNDPRWSAEIASAIGYQPRDTVCASAEKDGRLFGALQLLNAKDGFDAAHMEVARYIGLTAAALLERLS